jgi:hypothetical protein
MSRELPRRPSLDHLKKQAKELLRELRLRQPDAALTDAQHALAKEYGFPSWPQLKRHVELLANVPITVTFERYTPEARKALFFSRYEASQAGSTTIEPEHLLLGLIRVGEAVVGQFGRSGLSLQPARSALVVQAAEPIPSSTMIPVSDRVRPVFGAAAQEADRQQHQSIGLVHLLLGVLRDGDSAAAGWLAARGVRAESIRADIMSWLDERPEA